MKKSKLYTISIKDWPRKVKGVLLKESGEWAIFKQIFSDYIIDGYILINKQFIVSYEHGKDEIFEENVLKASDKWNFNYNIDIPLLSIHSIIKYLHQNNIVFKFQHKEEKVAYIGKVNKILEKSFYLTFLDVKGFWWLKPLIYHKKYIRTIEFDVDYINSLLMYNEKYNPKYEF
jgi:hypothetical protein